MSTKMGNEFRKMGNSLPISALDLLELPYETAIALALREELGGSNQAIKTLMRRTDASERTAKNWLSGAAGPSGAHLIDLMRSSDLVFEVVLRMAGRERALSNSRLVEAKDLLIRAIRLLGGDH
jgi:hypothetical protein